MDLESGIWQVEINPEGNEKIAYVTGQGVGQFKVMPFGLCNAPETFKCLMETVLGGLSYEACLVDFNDIINVGRSSEEHLNNIRRVLQKLKEANLKLSPSKFHLFRLQVIYLDHIILAGRFLAHPETGKQFIRDTDASHESIRAVLSQEIDGLERVQYFSKCLSRPERNYCMTRKELFAIFSRQVSTPSESDPWSYESVRKDQLTDPEIKPIIEFKGSCDETLSCYILFCLFLWEVISLNEPVGWRGWFVTGLLHLKLRVQPQPKSVEFLDAENRQRSCRMIIWHPEACPIPDQLTVARILVHHWISRHGVPLQLHSNQGETFDSTVCKRLREVVGFTKTRTTALHSQSSGMADGSIGPS
ncbi:retrovirus-related Pol polyprotein from transposon 17.6 [Trichonephila clavipes]|nr:retrovirus-related Pol polyprotein from transposon 17.6 [Trichonephila clavipes]